MTFNVNNSNVSKQAVVQRTGILDPKMRDCFIPILHLLSPKDIQNLACTTSDLNVATIKITNPIVSTDLKGYIRDICYRLDHYSQANKENLSPGQEKRLRAVIESLQRIEVSLMNGNFPNLLSLKKDSILLVKKQIIEVLTILDNAELEALQGIPRPAFCEKIPLLIAIDKYILEAKALPDESERSSALYEGLTRLLEEGEIAKAIAIISDIPMDEERNSALCAISLFLLKEGKIVEALEIANDIPGEYVRSTVLHKISLSLLAEGKIPEATDIARSIPDELLRSINLRDISRILFKEGFVSEAKKLAKTIPDETERELALRDISEAQKKGKSLPTVIDLTREYDGREISRSPVIDRKYEEWKVASAPLLPVISMNNSNSPVIDKKKNRWKNSSAPSLIGMNNDLRKSSKLETKFEVKDIEIKEAAPAPSKLEDQVDKNNDLRKSSRLETKSKLDEIEMAPPKKRCQLF